MRTLFLCAAIWVALPWAAFGQQSTFQDPLLDRLEGDWIMRGQMDGKPSVYDLDARWVLNHQYLRLQEVSREKDPKGGAPYAADMYFAWDAPTHEYVCAFMDTFGGFSKESIGRARSGEKDKIEFVYNVPDEGGIFHATFNYDPLSDTWRLGMDMEKNGKFSPFARLKLSRK